MDDLVKQVGGSYKTDRQAREVYRYFQPANPAALNATWPPLDDDSASITYQRTVAAAGTPTSATTPAKSSVVSSPNATLTSFAQLAALRLNAQRAFITYNPPLTLIEVSRTNRLSVLDRDSQFILAEATRTINVRNSTLYEKKGDSLWAGTSKVANPWNVCQVRKRSVRFLCQVLVAGFCLKLTHSHRTGDSCSSPGRAI